MQGLMLVAESADLLPEFRRILVQAFPTAAFHSVVDGRGFVLDFLEQPPNRIWVEDAGPSLEAIGWEPAEITFITSYFSANKQVYSIDYHNINTIKKVIVLLADSDQFLVDNDCGTLLLGKDFVHKVRAEPDWYWFDDLK